MFYLNIACTKSKCYGRADPSSLPVKEREIDGREPMTLADINRLINSKYEANLRRNISDQKVSSHKSAKWRYGLFSKQKRMRSWTQIYLETQFSLQWSLTACGLTTARNVVFYDRTQGTCWCYHLPIKYIFCWQRSSIKNATIQANTFGEGEARRTAVWMTTRARTDNASFAV